MLTTEADGVGWGADGGKTVDMLASSLAHGPVCERDGEAFILLTEGEAQTPDGWTAGE
jgi:hypothetical protein